MWYHRRFTNALLLVLSLELGPLFVVAQTDSPTPSSHEIHGAENPSKLQREVLSRRDVHSRSNSTPSSLMMSIPLDPDWIDLGCYMNGWDIFPSPFVPSVESAKLTPNYCAQQCKIGSYQIAAVGHDSCRCSNYTVSSPSPAPVADSECNTTCTGDAVFNCGGNDRIAIFWHGNGTNAPLMPPADGPQAGWTLKGCYGDIMDGASPVRILSGGYNHSNPSMTPSMCTKSCSSLGYSHAGVENGNECWCAQGYRISPPTFPDNDCLMPCAGNSNRTCGGDRRIAVYTTLNSTTTSPTPASSTSSTPSSTTSSISPAESTPWTKRHPIMLAIIAGSIGGGIVVILFVGAGIYLLIRKRRELKVRRQPIGRGSSVDLASTEAYQWPEGTITPFTPFIASQHQRERSSPPPTHIPLGEKRTSHNQSRAQGTAGSSYHPLRSSSPDFDLGPSQSPPRYAP